MNSKKLAALVLAISLIGFVSGAQAEDKKAGPEFTPAQMQKMEEAGSPGKEHAVLNAFEGNWKVTAHSWMAPHTKAMESTGKSSISWILGGRFLQHKYKGSWAGQPFEGLNLLGYNKVRNQYESVWIDSMMTSMMKSTGKYNAATQTVHEAGTFDCPIQGKNTWFRAEWKSVSKNKHTYTMFTKGPNGKEFKSMELVYQR